MRTALALTLVLCACSKSSAPTAVKRATLRPAAGTSFELVPEPNQLPFCQVYTVSSKGVIRQLTMSADNTSFDCPAGEPIGHHTFRVPAGEAGVKILVLFTSQSVSATSVSAQLLEVRHAATMTAIDLRLPGQATLETIEFTAPSEAPTP